MRRFMMLTLIVVLIQPGFAADKSPPAGNKLQTVVEQSTEQFVQAFHKRDAAAVASLFTQEAEYIDGSGVIFHGQRAIEAEFAAAFAVNPPGTMSIRLISIRPIAEGVLVEDGISTFTAADAGPTSQTHYTATHVRQSDGRWLIASLRELDADSMTPHDRLQALSWLLGDWHEDVDGSTISTRWKWSEDENYLLGQFRIQQSAEIVWSGTHRIGWDAGRNQFRSWVFESSGASLEGSWSPNDDGSWSVNLSGFSADGLSRSSTLTYLADGPEALQVIQTQRLVDGNSLPGSSHRVVRRPPGAELSSSQK